MVGRLKSIENCRVILAPFFYRHLVHTSPHLLRLPFTLRSQIPCHFHLLIELASHAQSALFAFCKVWLPTLGALSFGSRVATQDSEIALQRKSRVERILAFKPLSKFKVWEPTMSRVSTESPWLSG